MIDHLLKSADQASMLTAVGSYNPDGRGALWNAGGGDTPAGWRPDIAFVPLVTDHTNPTAPVVLADFHLWVALPSQDATLSANPDCILVGDREKAVARDPTFIIQTSMTNAQMAVYTISPVLTVANGLSYPFGSP
jgi:hypothetical protein